MSFEFKPNEQVEHAVRRIARAEFRDLIAALTGRRRFGRDKLVHDARKRLKKLRALVRLVRDAIGSKTYRRENRALRDVGRAFSTARDAKVLVDSFDKLLAYFKAHVSPRSFGAIRRKLVARRLELQKDAMELGERVYGETPKAFVQRMGWYWETWRRDHANP